MHLNNSNYSEIVDEDKEKMIENLTEELPVLRAKIRYYKMN